MSNVDSDTAIDLSESDLNKLHDWCLMNKLTINCKKTKYCAYGLSLIITKSKLSNTILPLNNQTFDRVCSYRYLVFTNDEHLNFNRHVEEIGNIISHTLYLLSKVCKYLTTDACILIFKTMILSLFEYRDIIYRGMSTGNKT